MLTFKEKENHDSYDTFFKNRKEAFPHILCVSFLHSSAFGRDAARRTRLRSLGINLFFFFQVAESELDYTLCCGELLMPLWCSHCGVQDQLYNLGTQCKNKLPILSPVKTTEQ